MLLGALLGRCGEALVHYPGGCSIGSRPIDLHLSALKQMGVEFSEEGDLIHARTGKLRGAQISLPYPSVGATENVLLASNQLKYNALMAGVNQEFSNLKMVMR